MTIYQAWVKLGMPKPPVYIRDKKGSARIIAINVDNDGIWFGVYYTSQKAEESMISLQVTHVIKVMSLS